MVLNAACTLDTVKFVKGALIQFSSEAWEELHPREIETEWKSPWKVYEGQHPEIWSPSLAFHRALFKDMCRSTDG
jgi:hypothetical protein